MGERARICAPTASAISPRLVAKEKISVPREERNFMSVFTQEKVYWIGPRESDISAVKDLFAGSITIFGSNQEPNFAFCNSESHPGRIDHNNTSYESDRFLVEKARELVEKDPSVKFMLYNSNIFNTIEGFSAMQEKYHCILCMNDGDLLRRMNDKHTFHEWLNGIADVLHIVPCVKANSDYRNVYTSFSSFPEWHPGCRFIIQAPVASGGSGTFILDDKNEKAISPYLDSNATYLSSVYQENNVSVNIHAIIYSDEILLTPGSIQIMKEDDLRLMYRGADFVAFRGLDAGMRKKFKEQTLIACKEFQRRGYRGVCGIDAIFSNNKVLLLEVNNRFQSSTNLLNFGLKKLGFKSIQELDYDAFCNPRPETKDREIENAEIDFSDYAFIFTGTNEHCDMILDRANKCPYVDSIDLDGYRRGMGTYANVSHLYRINFNTNIVWVNEDHLLNLHENIVDPVKDWIKRIRTFGELAADQEAKIPKESMIALKVALMTQGVVFSAKAEKYLETHGGFRPATNDAIDLKVGGRLVVNAPISIKFAEFSPFEFDIEGGDEGQPILNYYGEKLCEISYFKIDPFQQQTTKNGVPFSDVAYLSTDRLRVHLTNYCKYKRKNQGCRFCNMATEVREFSSEDLEEVLAAYYDSSLSIRHFLVGGQSEEDAVAEDKLIATIAAIRRHWRLNKIYAMILPCSNEMLDKMHSEGLNEIAFNIEIFDEACARKYMPGKGQILRSEYIRVLQRAVGKFGRAGNTRSMVIVGLEPWESMERGIFQLIDIGVQPLLSVFRPLPETPLEHLIPPSMKSLCDLFLSVTERMEKMNCQFRLGPVCVFCQNNTLSLPE